MNTDLFGNLIISKTSLSEKYIQPPVHPGVHRKSYSIPLRFDEKICLQNQTE